MKAFTLIEVLVSALILSIFVVGVFLVLNTGDITYNMDTAWLDLRQQARLAMDRMVRELREAKKGSVSISGGTTITFNTLTASNIQYYRSGTQNRAIREHPAGTTQILGNFINSLSFCCWHDTPSPGQCNTTCAGSNLVEIQLTASNTVKGRNLSFPLKEQVRLRNE